MSDKFNVHKICAEIINSLREWNETTVVMVVDV